MPKWRGTRVYEQIEDVEVEAPNYYAAMELMEDDDPSVKVLDDRQGDYEVRGRLYQVIPGEVLWPKE